MIEKQTDSEITERYRLDVSSLLNLPVPQECIEGIQANCELLRFHASKVESFDIPVDSDEGFDE